MNDMTTVTQPKSDQLNADDLIGGPRTITVSRVDIRPGTEQPVSIHYEGEDGRPYKPCKSMCRVMVFVWGADASKYAGRAMTLYRDPSVKWGGIEVGGIRISHMTNMTRELVMSLTATKGSRKPYTVRPLEVAADDRSLVSDAEKAAARGVPAYRDFFMSLLATDKSRLVESGDHDRLKAAAEKITKQQDRSPPAAKDTEEYGTDLRRDQPGASVSDTSSDDFPGDETIDPIAAAEQRGEEAARLGVKRRGLPGDLRDDGRELEAEAWERGHDRVTSAGKDAA